MGWANSKDNEVKVKDETPFSYSLTGENKDAVVVQEGALY